MKHFVKNSETGEKQWLSVGEILEEINRDRSDSWEDYDEDDWLEGMNQWTSLRLVHQKRFLVPVSWRVSGSVEVFADSPEDAVQIALHHAGTADTKNAEYDDWSFDVGDASDVEEV